ncbi:hypothetical protein [Bradyrhizobium sp.]|uniref:hypothetical protein n=1 Tax=Bradyrhizobium sp. TaxID=376 RepID=UPI0039E29BCA
MIWVLLGAIFFALIGLIVSDARRLGQRDEKNSEAARANKIAPIALAVSMVSPIVAAGGIYFATFYKPVDISVLATVLRRADVGTNTLQISLVFSNAGKRPAVIERVVMAMLSGQSASIDDAADRNLATAIFSDEFSPLPGPIKSKWRNDALLEVYDPTATLLNNQPAATTATILPESSTSLSVLRFAPDPRDRKGGPIVVMVGVQIYDGIGVRKRVIVPIGTSDDPMKDGGHRYNPALGSLAKLLP